MLRSPRLDDVRRGIEVALAGVRATAGKTILIVDQVDALLATGAAGATSLSVQNMLLSLREVRLCHPDMVSISWLTK